MSTVHVDNGEQGKIGNWSDGGHGILNHLVTIYLRMTVEIQNL